MSTCASFQVRMASIMEVLLKTAVAEITKLVDDGSAALRLEVCRSQRQNEELKRKLLLMEGELRAVRGYGEGAPGNSINLSLDVQVCDEFRDAPMVAWKADVSPAERVLNGRLSTHPARDDQNVPAEKKPMTPEALNIKCESIDGEQDWSESLLLSEDRPVKDPKSSQSQVEQKIHEENTCGTSGAAAANGGEGPLCKEEVLHMQPCPTEDPEKWLQAELKQEPEGQPLTPTLPLMESVEWGLQIPSVWSEANNLEKTAQRGGSLGHGDARIDDVFSPPHYTYWRPCSEKGEGPASHLEQKRNGRSLDKKCAHGPADDISAEMAFPLGSPGQYGGIAPCKPSSDMSAEAKNPYRIEGQEEELICTCCGKTFLGALELKTHEEQHISGNRFNCSECGKDFSSSSVLEKHLRIHCSNKPFACSGSNKSFSQSHVLQAHKSPHSGQKPYACTECGKHFHYKFLLTAHQSVHARGKPFTCEQCGKSFSQKSSLKTHQVTHTREKLFTCEQCGKCFAIKSSLISHQRVHTGEKPHHCKECGQCFTQRSNLKSHQRVHTREKPYTCDQCGKCFSQKSNLTTHQRVHTKEKPFTCKECGKCFSRVFSLKNHQSVHTGEKPHQCNECGKSFAKLYNLTYHQRVHRRGKKQSVADSAAGVSPRITLF